MVAVVLFVLISQSADANFDGDGRTPATREQSIEFSLLGHMARTGAAHPAFLNIAVVASSGDTPDKVFTPPAHSPWVTVEALPPPFGEVEGPVVLDVHDELALIVVSPKPAPKAKPVPKKKARCGTYYNAPPDVERWRKLVNEYFPKCWRNWALRVMQCESRGKPKAENPKTRAAGLFQHLPRYWKARAAKAGFAGASPFNAEANIAASARLLGKGATSHWKGCNSRK